MCSDEKVPADFPRELTHALLPGSNPKLAIRLIDGKYYAGLTEEELLERYKACNDLAQQLASYCTRKESENPSWTRDFNLARTRAGVARKVTTGLWDLSAAEQHWVMVRVQQLLGW
ncbi:hypothetical protein [Paraburkholderia youngii]|uniref:hypothetical protein n=1 Tax=Paraburkholderia youngii TaxID=2782701 RepID=UPI003D1EEF18